jgi:hypothetical protein
MRARTRTPVTQRAKLREVLRTRWSHEEPGGAPHLGAQSHPGHHGRVTWLGEGASAVIFDFFGTLTPGTPAGFWLDHASQIATVMGVDGHALRAAWRDSSPGVLPAHWAVCRRRCGWLPAGSESS